MLKQFEYIPNSADIVKPKRNPRASKPTIASIFIFDFLTRSINRSRIAVHTRPSKSDVNISLQ